MTRLVSISVLVIRLMSSSASARPLLLQSVWPLSVEDARLVDAFAECAGPFGPSRELPEAVLEAGEFGGLILEFGGLILLSEPGIVSDGYYHWLSVQRSTGLVYIIQIGGIAGHRTIFGPFHAEEGCTAVPAIGPRSPSAGLTR